MILTSSSKGTIARSQTVAMNDENRAVRWSQCEPHDFQ